MTRKTILLSLLVAGLIFFYNIKKIIFNFFLTKYGILFKNLNSTLSIFPSYAYYLYYA